MIFYKEENLQCDWPECNDNTLHHHFSEINNPKNWNISENEMSENNWVPIGHEYPPYDEKVLVTDGKSVEIRILKVDDNGIKYWSSLHENMKGNVSHWRSLSDFTD